LLTQVGEEEALKICKSLLERCGSDALMAALGLPPRNKLMGSIFRRKCKPFFTSKADLTADLEFLGGFIKFEGFKRGLAFPSSYATGRQVASILLSWKLKGIYADDYTSQGDLIWKSVLLRLKRAETILSSIGIDDPSLALESSLRSTKLWPLMVILTSQDVTEGYAHLGGPLYIDHVEYGRFTVTNYVLDYNDLEKLITFVEADINAGFDLSSPLSEIDLRMGDYHFRIALDVPPASLGAVDIRNLSSMSRLSLPRLISLGTLTVDDAAIILTCIERGDPILIFGRTGVGKTTLSNAILASLPRSWRIVTVEEVREIEDLSKYGMHHTPYEVTSNKLDFVRFLLHRNPDMVFLGEVLGRDHAEALDLTFFSGLKVMATTHARDFKDLTEKWKSWGLNLPERLLAVKMDGRRVVDIRYLSDMGWISPPSPSERWLSHVRSLEGAYTNEEVSKRVEKLLAQG